MKYLVVLLLVISVGSIKAQYEDVAPGWTKQKDRALIIQKMDELLTEVSFKFDCEKDSITYLVTETHQFYKVKKEELHFPKHVSVKACGETYFYLCQCKQNAYGKPKEWIKGEWMILPVKEE